jgi:GNAT superfamily N-acetyltransferase
MCAQLVNYLTKYAKEIYLETDEKNFPARKIYEGLGFVEIGHSLFVDHGSGIVGHLLASRDYYQK